MSSTQRTISNRKGRGRATDQAIEACGDDARDAHEGVIVANEFLEAQVEDLRWI